MKRSVGEAAPLSAVFKRIEAWYRRMRIHGSFGYLSLDTYEAPARDG